MCLTLIAIHKLIKKFDFKRYHNYHNNYLMIFITYKFLLILLKKDCLNFFTYYIDIISLLYINYLRQYV